MELTLFGDFCYCDNCCCMKLLLVDGHRRRRGMAVVPVRRGLSLTIGSWSCLLPIDTDTTANCSAFGPLHYLFYSSSAMVYCKK